MILDNIFNQIKENGYVEDKTYNVGDISEATGLQKQPDGSWKPPKKSGFLNKEVSKEEFAQGLTSMNQSTIKSLLDDLHSGKITEKEFKIKAKEANESNARLMKSYENSHAKSQAGSVTIPESKKRDYAEFGNVVENSIPMTKLDQFELSKLKRYMADDGTDYKEALRARATRLADQARETGSKALENEQSIMNIAHAVGYGKDLHSFIEEELHYDFAGARGQAEKIHAGVMKTMSSQANNPAPQSKVTAGQNKLAEIAKISGNYNPENLHAEVTPKGNIAIIENKNGQSHRIMTVDPNAYHLDLADLDEEGILDKPNYEDDDDELTDAAPKRVLTGDTMIRVRAATTEDKRYNVGDISEATGKQKQPDGSWKYPKNGMKGHKAGDKVDNERDFPVNSKVEKSNPQHLYTFKKGGRVVGIKANSEGEAIAALREKGVKVKASDSVGNGKRTQTPATREQNLKEWEEGRKKLLEQSKKYDGTIHIPESEKEDNFRFDKNGNKSPRGTR